MSKISRERAAANTLASVRAEGLDPGIAAVIVIDVEDFKRSQKDPRVHDLFDRGRALHADLEAKNANF
jgi:hypothetical protein